MPPYGSLQDDDKVYLAIRSRGHKDDTEKVKPNAFFLRPQDCGPNNGVSVIINPHCPTLEEAMSLTGLTKIYGIDGLTVREIRSLGLDVIQDADTHAYISGLPFRHDVTENLTEAQKNDAKKADVLANKLSEISQMMRRP